MVRLLTIIMGSCLVFLILMPKCRGQCTDIQVNKRLDNLDFSELVRVLESQSEIHFYYNPDSIPVFPIRIEKDSMNLLVLLQKNFRDHHIFVSCDNQGNFYLTYGLPVICEIAESAYSGSMMHTIEVVYQPESDNFISTKSEYINDTLIIGRRDFDNSYYKADFSGTVIDCKTGEPVIGATIYVEELRTGIATGTKGNFRLTVPAGEYTLVVSSLDKIPHKYNLYIYSSGSSVLYLESKVIALDEVIISAGRFDKLKSTQMGIERLTAREIKEIPVVLGERDVLKVALMLPGVQQTGEGATGFNVRGSPADQNVFYLNDIPIYNVNHLVGFFSAFHPEAVNEFSLYKSNIPVQYGGRLSSIFDIDTKKGNREKFGMRGGISPVSANILFDHPLIREKGSIMIGGRSTYSNWLLRRIDDPSVRNSNVYFGDLLSSVEFEIGKSDQVELFGYYSYDNINYNDEIKHAYSNQGAALKWNHILNEKHHFESSMVYSRYDFDEINREIVFDFYRHSYFLQHYQWKNSFTLHFHPRHNFTAGIDNILYYQSRGKHRILQYDQVISSTDLGTEQALETGVYVGDEWDINGKISAYAGLRYNFYNYLGPQDIFSYNSGEYLVANIIDTTHYRKFSIIKTYQKPDVRLALKYLVHSTLSVKLSFNQLQQNIFMLSNSLSISPTDKWKFADYHIKPLQGKQYSLGFYFNSFNRKWELTAEGYYKQVSNLVEYKDGANLLITEVPETELLQGDLKAYGLEFMIERTFGNLTGWLNYTFTNTRVQVESDYALSQVNNGLPFPASYDKPHSVNLISNYRFRKRFSLSWNIVYSTGRPYTSPVSVYFLNENPVINYSARNELRIPDYFRIDLSFNVEGNLLRKKLAHGSWMFSVYNLTGRKNAYSVYFIEEEGQIRGYKLSIFGTSVYTLTYIFKLGNYND